jgi:hypothetical protein
MKIGYIERMLDRGTMVFDWDMAARIIRERGLTEAWAGLSGDWDNTAGVILKDGKPYGKDYTFLASVWAMPCIKFGDVVLPCYRMSDDTNGWDQHTKWPESAMEILKGGEEAEDRTD